MAPRACVAAVAGAVAALLPTGALGQCCPDGSTPTCSSGTFSMGPPPACSGGGNPTCTTGSVGPNQACNDGSGGGGTAGGGTSPGYSLSAATGCSTTDGTTCADDGSTSETIVSDLKYDKATGKFTGTLKANMCPPTTAKPGTSALKSSCKSFTFPSGGASAWSSPPYAAPLRGSVAFTFSLNYVYGPMDAGFGAASTSAPGCDKLPSQGNFPEVCSKTGVSCCPPGSTAAHCEDKIRYECETASGTVTENMFLDDCGFHTPDNYHCHVAPRCDYNQENPDGHSPIVAVAADGYGMYGVHETTTTLPDLDACGGHTHTVPANPRLGIESSSVYHYHFTPYAPYTLGCYGPAASLAECKAKYTECSESTGTKVTWTGRYKGGADYTAEYMLDCPCFQHKAYTDAQKADFMSKLKPHYMDIMSTVDNKGYNTAGKTLGANGYYNDGSGMNTSLPLSPSPAPAPGASINSAVRNMAVAGLLSAALAFPALF